MTFNVANLDGTDPSRTPLEAMRIDSSGNVGIGTDSPFFTNATRKTLSINGTGSSNLSFGANGTAYGNIFVASNEMNIGTQTSANPLGFVIGGSEKARIDSSGNLLVGQSTFNTGNVGGGVTNYGFNYGTVDGGLVARFTRLTSDGDIMQFRKNGSTVGSIGTKLGGLYIADGGVGLRFDSGGTDDIFPSNSTGDAADASINLGSSGARFKDLHLSGTAHATSLLPKTSDGADNQQLVIGGGGAATDSRGASIHLAGNENGNAGLLQLRAGSGSASQIRLYTGASERMRIDASGKLSVGVAGKYSVSKMTANYDSVSEFGLALRDTGSSSTAAMLQFVKDGNVVGVINSSTTATAYNTSSDYRLKTDAQPMTGASARVQALNPVNFKWISDGSRVDGFLAHEAQAVVPESVTGTKDAMMDEEYEVTPAVLDEDGNVTTEAVMGTRSVPDYQGIDQSKLVPLLTAALQEALTEIESLKTRLTALEG
jgi:hypothetical protein